MQDKQIIAFDLDGTLTESNQPMEREMAGVLVNLLQKKKVAIITGASFKKMSQQLAVLFENENFKNDDHLKENLYLLPTNGLSLYLWDKKISVWEEKYMSGESIRNKEEIVNMLNEIIASRRFGIPEKGKGDFIGYRGAELTFSGLGQDAPLEEKKAWDPDHKKRQEIVKELQAKIKDANFVIGGNTTIDILPKGFDKAEGLQKFLTYLDLVKSDMFFMGDAIFPGGNDNPVKESGIDSEKVSGPRETMELINKYF